MKTNTIPFPDKEDGGNKLIADFDEKLKYRPTKAGYEIDGSATFIPKLFNTFQECFDFCQLANEGLHPDECFFALPIAPNFKLTYHLSYNSLMPVVEQIESLNNKAFSFFIVQNECDIAFSSKYKENGEEWDAPNFKKQTDCKRLSVWQAVVHFLQWYDNN